jgi:hypothetical protein
LPALPCREFSSKQWTELFRSDAGSAVLAGLVNIALATLVTLSVLALSLAGYYSLVIRNLAVDAATNLATYGASSQREYLLQRLRYSVPELASFEVSEVKNSSYSAISVKFGLPGFGLSGITQGRIDVQAATERL